MDDDTTFTRNDLQDSELKASYARPNADNSAQKQPVSIAGLLA